ncbi:MAG: FAD-dependent monooxygenase, partial [Rhodobacteraceae bacterium]|nr:FAD-dependent monooxygenase [Paracoccaceae bacterium]
MIRHLPEVTVIGAGIGGLAVATALARCGVPVRVLEQAPAVTEVGAGLQITPNGAAVLRGLGLGTAVARAGIAAQGIRLRQGATGRRLTSLNLA